MLLHAFALLATVLVRDDGCVDADEAERLAERCGALVAELLEAGIWRRTMEGYAIEPGMLRLRDLGWYRLEADAAPRSVDEA